MATTIPQPAPSDVSDQTQPGSQEQPDQQGDPRDPLASDTESQEQLYQLYLKFKTEDRYARMVEVRECAHDRMYWRSQQYIWWSDRDKCFNTSTGSQAWLNYGNYDIDDMPHFEFVTNIYQSAGLNAIALVTGSPPAYRFYPENPQDYRDIETAKGYDKLAKKIERWNPIKGLMQDEVYFLWCDGVVGLLTEFEEEDEGAESGAGGGDGSQDMGQEGGEETEEVRCQVCGWHAPASHFVPPVPCPECGTMLTSDNLAPADSGGGGGDDFAAIFDEMSYGDPTAPAKGKQTITVWGALEMGRPQWAKEQSKFHYLELSEELHYTQLRDEYPWAATKIKPGASSGADDSFERNARLSVAEGANLLTQTGGALSVLCTKTRVWFRKCAFRYFENLQTQQKFEQKFPDGCLAIFTGPTYLTSRPQSMDKCWVVRHMMPGDGQHRNGWGSSSVSVQDRYNTESNIRAETYEYGLPVTYKNSQIFDDQAPESQRSEPGADVTVNLRDGQRIQDNIMTTRVDSASPDMVQDMEEMRGPILQQLTGLYPAAVGDPAGSPDTFRGMAIQNEAAKGRTGIPYGVLKQAHADIMTLSCNMFRDNVNGPVILAKISDSGDFEADTVDVPALEGNARAYPEGDENFPETWSQKRATVLQVADTPQGQQLMTEPDNAELMVELLGVEGLVIPGADARQKQLREISEMKEGVPVDIDPDVDDNAAEAATCKRYLNSQDGQDLKRENPQAYEAVKQHMMQHKQVVQQQQAQQVPPMQPVKPSVTANLKDMPPAAIIQALAEMGIHVTMDDIAAGKLMDKLSKPQPVVQPPGQPSAGGKPPVNGKPPQPTAVQ